MKGWYAFVRGKADGHRDLKDRLGGKGANLAEMCRMGIPVPPGFTLPTMHCLAYSASGGKLSREVEKALVDGVAFIESHMGGARFGDRERPLLVSVRSGARASMPGMMDTVLNLGLTKDTVQGLARWTNDRRFALDAYRRLIQMYGDVVCGVEREKLNAPLEALKRERGVKADTELGEHDLESLVGVLLDVFAREVGHPFPQDPREQLRAAVAAVFGSWNGKRAITYRKLHGIPDTWGTAANVQAMVFGNLGATSGTGVCFTRDPSTGEAQPMGEWLAKAQGEDVVAGVRTPGPLSTSEAVEAHGEVPALERAMPEVYTDLRAVMTRLEKHFKDVQDIEFTIQDGKLYILQTRNAKRSARAALRCAVDLANEGMIDRETALLRVTPEQINQLMHPQVDPAAPKDELGKGLAASPGAASGHLALDAEEAEARAKNGEDVLLVRRETSPEDIHGMAAARGILTATGGMTSHAAVVARGMGRPCVSGCQAMQIDEVARRVSFQTATGVRTFAAGDMLTIDGTTGRVYAGKVPTIKASLGGELAELLGWADRARKLGVWANADTPNDARVAVELGAEGIGLCRTEHMFFAPDRIRAMREMILATSTTARETALAKLAPMQRSDFVGIFQAMAGRPVTVRLLDPPLHEFLPQGEREIAELAADLGLTVDHVKNRIVTLHEQNPMLGHRGCRLGLVYPEVSAMQARSIFEAACDVAAQGVPVKPEIMIPLVMLPAELELARHQIDAIALAVFESRGRRVAYHVGTMIELPRAALVADRIAAHADFFSFGTNDLTQTTMGLSRDDAGRFLPWYIEKGLFAQDPFASLDVEGVGQLVEMATKRGRAAKHSLKVGICGEHGGDPASIHFFAKVGLDYVSCSPYRVPIARLAAAHAELEAHGARGGADTR